MTQKYFKNEDETVLMIEIKGSKEEIKSLYKSLSSSVINVLNLNITKEENSYEDKSISCENDDPDFNPFIGKEKESEKETPVSKEDTNEDVDMSIFS